MIKLTPNRLAVIAVLAMTALSTHGETPKNENKLLGTWKLATAKYGGKEFRLEEGSSMIKHVTPSQFMWVTYDKDGKVTRAAGGTYSIDEDAYKETPQYGISADFDLIKGKPQTFKWKIEGDKWHHDGELSNGLTIDEMWERVEKRK